MIMTGGHSPFWGLAGGLGVPSKGLLARNYWTDRSAMVENILKLLMSRNVLILRAAPFTGKTSTAQLLARLASEYNYEVVGFNAAKVTREHSFESAWALAGYPQSFADTLRSPPGMHRSSTGITLLIIDEAQTLYDIQTGSQLLWGYIKMRMAGEEAISRVGSLPSNRLASPEKAPPSTYDRQLPATPTTPPRHQRLPAFRQKMRILLLASYDSHVEQQLQNCQVTPVVIPPEATIGMR